MTTTTLTVRTVGLDLRKNSELTLLLAGHPQIDLQHYPAWHFGLLHADVIVIGTDASVGQETLDMLKHYAGAKHPVLVTFSGSGEQMRTLSGGGGEPSFTSRLEDALRRAGGRNFSMAKATSIPPENPAPTPRAEGGAARAGIQWRD